MYFADLHVHSSFKAFNNKMGGKDSSNSLTFSDSPNDIWENFLEDYLTMVPYTQGSLTQADKGKARILFLSLLPLEIGWTQIESNWIFKFLFQNRTLANLASSVSLERMGFVEGIEYSYNKALQQEYDFILNELNINRNHEVLKKAKIVNSISEAKIEADAGNIAIILCIEGAHAVLDRESTQGIAELIKEAKIHKEDVGAQEHLIRVNLEHDNAELCKKLMKCVDNFIDQIKSWSYKPFYITLAHHFFNGFAGHALSFPKTTGKKLNQSLGMNYGLTLPGKYLVQQLCKLEGKDRIYIDTKHLSVKARKETYEILKKENRIPMVSHTAVNGWRNYDESLYVHGKIENNEVGVKKYYENLGGTNFNNWSINLSNEEIVYVLKEKSLIGIILDQRVLSNKEIAKDINKNPRNYQYIETIAGIEQVYRQIKHVCETGSQNNISLKDSFASLCIGSDFDGLINPINDVRTLEFLHPYSENHLPDPFNKPYHDNESFYPGLYAGLLAIFKRELTSTNFWQELNKTAEELTMDFMCNNLINRLSTWK